MWRIEKILCWAGMAGGSNGAAVLDGLKQIHRYFAVPKLSFLGG